MLASLLCVTVAGLCADEPPPFGVSGTVLQASGAPVEGAEVRLVIDREGGADIADVVSTDGSGRFAVRGPIGVAE